MRLDQRLKSLGLNLDLARPNLSHQSSPMAISLDRALVRVELDLVMQCTFVNGGRAGNGTLDQRHVSVSKGPGGG
jgi:hypothetical protein